MNKYVIEDLIDEETDDVEVPIDQYWETAGNLLGGDRRMTKWYNVTITFKTNRRPELDERLINLLGQLVIHYAYVKTEVRRQKNDC